MSTQATIIFGKSNDSESIHDDLTCQIDSLPRPALEVDLLSDTDLLLLVNYYNTMDENVKKLYKVYFTLRIKRIMPVKTVFIEEILIESNLVLIKKMLVHLNDEEDEKEMGQLINLLSIYGMTWDIIHSLYVNGSCLSEAEHGKEIMFGLGKTSLTNTFIIKEITTILQEYLNVVFVKDQGFWVELQVDSDFHILLDCDWINGFFSNFKYLEYLISNDKLMVVFNKDNLVIIKSI